MIGRVVSDKTEKTVTVLVESRKTHPLYKKTYAWSKKYLVHNEVGAVIGDVVTIEKCRPISKRKHWIVTKVVGRDIVPMNEEALKKVSQEDIEEVMPEEKEEETVESEQPQLVVEEAVKEEKPKEVKKAKKVKGEKKVNQ
jgi:small subunit ribosomal protein S17